MSLKYKSTADIKIAKLLVDQVIGQPEAIEIIKKAALQRRHVLLIGEPGTGKSLTGQALAELLPKENLTDVVMYPNVQDENVPLVREYARGKGRAILNKAKLQQANASKYQNIIFYVLILISVVSPWWVRKQYGDILAAAALISSMIIIAIFVVYLNMARRMKVPGLILPKLLLDNAGNEKAPFLDATGAHAGALLGDVLHDPLQSGGLGTPAHERVVPGMIHRANKGVLFIDEVGNLQLNSQQELLTAMQEKKYPITGQSERSSGAMVRSEPVPCDFVLVAAGTLETIKRIHPALRSRVRGYGYEVNMNATMDDTPDNRDKIAMFIAQEVVKDGHIPHFTHEAVEVIIQEARRRTGRAGKLTLRLRELGGLVRTAGDIALEEKAKIVLPMHIVKAKRLARTLEQQIVDKFIEQKKEYDVLLTKGHAVGRVNGLAVLGSEGSFSGIVLPIESEVTPGGKKTQFVATGKLGEIAKEAVKNVSAIILKQFGEDLKEYDVFVQFLQTAASGVEGDSASIAVATAIISAYTKVPVRQDTALTGSLSVRGEVLAVGGVTQKVEAALQAGIARVLVPKANEKDVLLSVADRKKIQVIPVSTVQEVLKEALVWKGKESLLKKIK